MQEYLQISKLNMHKLLCMAFYIFALIWFYFKLSVMMYSCQLFWTCFSIFKSIPLSFLSLLMAIFSCLSLEHQPPYIIAVLPRYVEIRTLEPRLLVQSVELQRPRFITSAGWDLHTISLYSETWGFSVWLKSYFTLAIFTCT